MSDHTPNRVSAGVPTGGQFATDAKGEAAVSLSTSTKVPDMVETLGRPDLAAPGYEEPRAQYGAIVAQLASLPAEDAEKVRGAMDVAWQLHLGQVRKSTTIPYITHPLSNLQRLLDYGVTDPDILAAAALHDCVEDCSDVYAEHIGNDTDNEYVQRDVTQSAIDETFGPETGDIVAAVSNEPSSGKTLTRAEKNREYVAHAVTQIRAHFGAFMVKYSDLLDNAGTLKDATFDDPKRKPMLAEKYLPLIEAFDEVADEHERAGVMALPENGRAELRRELARVHADLTEILAA